MAFLSILLSCFEGTDQNNSSFYFRKRHHAFDTQALWRTSKLSHFEKKHLITHSISLTNFPPRSPVSLPPTLLIYIHVYALELELSLTNPKSYLMRRELSKSIQDNHPLLNCRCGTQQYIQERDMHTLCIQTITVLQFKS